MSIKYVADDHEEQLRLREHTFRVCYSNKNSSSSSSSSNKVKGNSREGAGSSTAKTVTESEAVRAQLRRAQV